MAWIVVALGALAVAGCGEERSTRTAVMDGTQAVPPNGSRASGTAIATLEGSRLKVTGTFGNLSGILVDVQGRSAHIREAAPGNTGPVIFALSVQTSDQRSGSFEGSFDLTEGQRNVYLAGNYYVVIYSDAFIGGEIRGQFSP